MAQNFSGALATWRGMQDVYDAAEKVLMNAQT